MAARSSVVSGACDEVVSGLLQLVTALVTFTSRAELGVTCPVCDTWLILAELYQKLQVKCEVFFVNLIIFFSFSVYAF